MYRLLLVLLVLCSAALAQSQYSSSGWRPILNNLFYRGPRAAPPRPVHGGERFQVAATQYQPSAYFSRNSFSHPFAHYGRPSFSRVPAFTQIPDAQRHHHNPAPAPAPSYAAYTHTRQPVFITAAPPTINYQVQQPQPQPMTVYMPLVNYATAAPPADYARAPALEPITARPTYEDLDLTSAARPTFNAGRDAGRDAVVTTRYQSDTQVSPEALTPDSDRERFHDFEREILGNVRSQAQVQVDSQAQEPEREQEAPRLTPQNIRLVFHDGADEQEVRATLREKSRNANEDATFIVAPEQRVLQRQRVMLPPPPQPVVYILLRKPVITSEVKFERQEAEADKKPRVFVSYEDVSKVVSKHIDLQTGKVKDHGPEGPDTDRH